MTLLLYKQDDKNEKKNYNYYSYFGNIFFFFVIRSYGEKVIPTPMEKIICSEDIIRNCIIVGENREGTAVLIELDREKASAYSSKEISDKGNIVC